MKTTIMTSTGAFAMPALAACPAVGHRVRRGTDVVVLGSSSPLTVSATPAAGTSADVPTPVSIRTRGAFG